MFLMPGKTGGLLFIALILMPYVSIAAGFSVHVKEKGSGVYIEGATVVLQDGEVFKQTSADGLVEFPESALPQQIKVLAPGFETLTRQVSAISDVITLYLEPIVFEGEGLEVTADRLVEKTSKFTLSVAELIRAAGSSGDPLKAITALPGIIATEENSSEVYMRGSNGNDNITWVNNAPVGYLYHFGGFQSTINPALIEDINVFLGGFPVKYGDALGGVIDARLRTPRYDRMHYKLDISTIAASFLVEGPVGKGGDGFFIAGRRSYLDLLLSPGEASDLFSDDDEDESEPDRVLLVPRFYDFQTLYRHQLNRGYIDTYLFAAGDELKLELNNEKADPQLEGQLRTKVSYQTAGLTWQQYWNKRWDSIATLAYVHEKSSDRIGRDELGNPFYARIEDRVLHLQPELHWYPKPETRFDMGFNGAYADIPVDVYAPRSDTEDDPDFDFTSQKKHRLQRTINAYELSPYIRYRRQWNNRLTTQFGLRHTNLGISGGFDTHTFSPRATLEYQATPDTLLSASWGKYIQIPEGEEVVKSFGNPSLLVTESEHRILGVEHQINPLYNVKAEIYHKPMKHLVIALDENDPPDNFSNRGSGEAYGFDLFLKRKAAHRKFGWLSLSWAKSERTNEITAITRDFSGDQPLTLTAVWGQPFGGNWKRWDWSIKAQAHSGRPYTEVTGRHREDSNDPNSRWIGEYGKHNAKRLPTYYKLDLRIAREVLLKESKLKLYLEMQNVTFAKNIVEYDYGDEFEDIDQPTEVTGTSFFPFIGVEMEF